MIIDVFPFFNEYELLKLRMRMLKGVVDMHLAISGTTTYQGEPFVLDYDKFFRITDRAMERPDGPVRAATLIVNTDGGFSTAWEREKHQRQGIRNVVHGWGVDDDDIIIYTDADELPASWVIEDFGNWPVEERKTHALQMRTFYYGTQWEDPNPTDRGKIFRWGEEKGSDWNDLRWLSPRFGDRLPNVADGGWHISYYGGDARIETKLRSFSHVEYSNDRAIRRIQLGHRRGRGPNNERLVRVDQTTLPRELLDLR